MTGMPYVATAFIAPESSDPNVARAGREALVFFERGRRRNGSIVGDLRTACERNHDKRE